MGAVIFLAAFVLLPVLLLARHCPVAFWLSKTASGVSGVAGWEPGEVLPMADELQADQHTGDGPGLGTSQHGDAWSICPHKMMGKRW